MDLPTLYIRAHVALHAANPDARCWDAALLLEAAYQQLQPPAVAFPDWVKTLAGQAETSPDAAPDPLADVAHTPIYQPKPKTSAAAAPPPESAAP
jgi:hypothetical protein